LLRDRDTKHGRQVAVLMDVEVVSSHPDKADQT